MTLTSIAPAELPEQTRARKTKFDSEIVAQVISITRHERRASSRSSGSIPSDPTVHPARVTSAPLSSGVRAPPTASRAIAMRDERHCAEAPSLPSVAIASRPEAGATANAARSAGLDEKRK
jgi:hypothetical protein